MTDRARTGSSSWLIVAAFAAIYLIWGSAYLAIRFAIETVPPLLMAGLRFLCAGVLLYPWARLRGAPRPHGAQWKVAVVVGALMMGGNGAVTWAEQYIPSGLAALLIATVPLWMVLITWLRGGDRPSAATAAGLGLGLVGIVLLVGPHDLLRGPHVDFVGALAVLVGALGWAAGSLHARNAKHRATPAALGTAMEMLCGGTLLCAAGLIQGDGARLQLGQLSLRSGVAFAFLVLFGSIVAFTAYSWLLRQTTAARASTYAYVNPVVAVILGWALAGEPLSPLTLVAAAFIVTAVALIVVTQNRKSAPRPAPPPGATPRDSDVRIAGLAGARRPVDAVHADRH